MRNDDWVVWMSIDYADMRYLPLRNCDPIGGDWCFSIYCLYDGFALTMSWNGAAESLQVRIVYACCLEFFLLNVSALYANCYA